MVQSISDLLFASERIPEKQVHPESLEWEYVDGACLSRLR
jgi:hypothetical protein